MSYTHTENGHRIVFADEEDYLRVRLAYLETGNFVQYEGHSFTSFVERGLYRGLEPRRRGRMEVRSVEHISPSSLPSWGVSGAMERIERSRAENQRRYQDELLARFDSPSRQLEHQSAMQRQIEQLTTAQNLALREWAGEPVPSGFEQIDWPNEFQASYNDPGTSPTVEKKEDIVEKKPKKNKTVFDIIDID